MSLRTCSSAVRTARRANQPSALRTSAVLHAVSSSVSSNPSCVALNRAAREPRALRRRRSSDVSCAIRQPRSCARCTASRHDPRADAGPRRALATRTDSMFARRAPRRCEPGRRMSAAASRRLVRRPALSTPTSTTGSDGVDRSNARVSPVRECMDASAARGRGRHPPAGRAMRARSARVARRGTCGSNVGAALIAGSLPAFERHELQVLGADVVGARADDLAVDALLDHVRRPAGWCAR